VNKFRNFNKKKSIFIILVCLFVFSVATLSTILSKQKQEGLHTIIRKPSVKKILGASTVKKGVPQVSSAMITSEPMKNNHNYSLGFVVDDYTNKTGEISALQQEIGSKFTTVSFYKQFGLPTNNMVTQGDLSYIKSQNMRALIAWEPWNPMQGTSQSEDYLQEIADGKQDTYIKSFADTIKAEGDPITIRFGHEMNGNWYPWGQRPQTYVTAYRRIVMLFRSEGVQNVTWMWSINADPLNNITSYYPGDAYVDIIGIDGYNYGTSLPGHTWQTFSQIFNPSYTILSSTYNKPIVISEIASSELGGDKAAWITDMFTRLNSMPKSNQIIWFNLLKETEWRITSSQTALAAFE